MRDLNTKCFPVSHGTNIFIYSLFFLNVNINIIAKTDAPIARIGMNRFVSSPVAGAESESGSGEDPGTGTEHRIRGGV